MITSSGVPTPVRPLPDQVKPKMPDEIEEHDDEQSA